MIVVVGSPVGRRTDHGIEAGGVAATVARVAAAAGSDVQLVGKVGEGVTGDAVLLALMRAGIGHVAVLRDSSHPTPVAASGEDPDVELEPLADDGLEPADSEAAQEPSAAGLPSLDGGDLQLALSYLPDYRVVVIAEPLDEPALTSVVAAARYAGARLIVVVPTGSTGAGLPDDATVLESPPLDPDGAFGAVVGAYAAALDRGAEPAEAFASASTDSGWSPVLD